jgi:signal transduction histidine kinase
VPARSQKLQDLVVKSRHLTYFRLAFSLVVLIFSLFLQHSGTQDIDPVILLAAGFSVLAANAIGLAFFSEAHNFSSAKANFFNAVLLCVDIAALSYAVHATRGIESDLFFLYLLPILLASNVFDRSGIFLTALASSAAYLSTVVLENAGFIPYLSGGAGSSGLAAAYAQKLWAQAASRSATLFIVSMIWAAFCHRMSRVAQESNLRLAEQLDANTELLEELKIQSKKEQLSGSISLALRRTLEIETILSTTCSRLSEALDGAHCLLLSKGEAASEERIWDSKLITDSGVRAETSRFTSVPPTLIKHFLEHSWNRKAEDGPENKILISRAPFLDNDDLREISSTLKEMGLTKILVRPIMYGNELKGLISILISDYKKEWQDSELELIDSVAGQVAIALEHAELLSKLSQTNADLLQKNERLDASNLELRQMQSQLIHHEKMASLGRIVAGIAHELNNPINFVHGNLPYLKEYVTEMKNLIACFDSLPDEHKKVAEEAKRKINYEFVVTDLDNIIADLVEGIDRMRQIIRDLRSFSRLDEAELKEASVEDGIESTLKILGQFFGRDKIPVELSFCGLPPVLCYPGKLNQVWMNLLSNAAHAVSGKEDARVVISTRQEGENFLVTIEDNGSGIKSADQSKIFEPFFTSKPVGQGTGLGLSISHSIVERHGGRIWFETEAGKGTRFMVRLPLKALPGELHEGQAIEN